MERKIHLLLIVFLHYCGIVNAQNNESIYNAFLEGDMASWKKTIDSLENLQVKPNELKIELINYQYGYVAWCIGTKNIEEAEKYVKNAERHIHFLESVKYKLSTVYAYKAAFIGFEIGISPYKAIFIGQESLINANKSVAMDSTNAFGYTQLGHIKFYTPKIFGGSKEKAIYYYLKALLLMEDDPELIKQNWNYLNLLATIIVAFSEAGNYSLAKDYSIKTLKIAPNFDWVRNELHPEIL